MPAATNSIKPNRAPAPIAGSAIFAAALLLAPPTPAAAEIDCAAAKTPLAHAICGDPTLADDDRWLGVVLDQRVAMADKATGRQLAAEQHKWTAERNKCLPSPPPPPAPQPDAPLPIEPQAKDQPDSKAALDAPPPAEPDKLATAPDKSADAQPDAPAPAEDQPAAEPVDPVPCLRKSYEARIETLEKPLRRFVDLIQDAPSSPDVCAAVAMLQAAGMFRLIPLHALPVTDIDEADEFHPTTKIEHLRRYLAADAWGAAAETDRTLATGLGLIKIARVALYDGKPKALILSTTSGADHDPSLSLFQVTDEGAKADQFIGHLGEQGSGPVDIRFIRFRGQPYAIEGAVLSKADARFPPIYALAQSRPACLPAAGQ